METQTINRNVFGDEQNPLFSDKGITQDADGSWRNALGYESTCDHKHVAKTWQDRCTHISQVILDIGDSEANQHDFTASLDELKLDNDLRLQGARFTSHGLQTLSRYVGLPSVATSYLSEHGYRSELAGIINREMQDLKSREGARHFLVRTTMDDDPRVNAIMSHSFSPIDHGEVVERVCRALPDGGIGTLATRFTDDDDSGNLILNLLLPDSFKSVDFEMGVGLSIANGRYGLAKLEITPYVFRSICYNGTRWGWRESNIGLRQKHAGRIDRDRLQAEIQRAINVGLSGGNDLLAVMGYASEIAIADPKRMIASLSHDAKLSLDQTKAWMRGYDDEPIGNACGVIGGLTRGAQKLSDSVRNQLEAVAGSLLAPSIKADCRAVEAHWARLISRASNVSDEMVERLTAV